MTAPTQTPLVRHAGEGERRWFFGGGIHTWLATSAETGGAFLLFEDMMTGGKATPLHVHPLSDESFYVLEGTIAVHLDGVEHVVASGGLVTAPRGVPHAFAVLSETARVLCLHTPGHCEAFYRGASVPLGEQDGTVDVARVQAAAAADPGIELLGPPPFAY